MSSLAQWASKNPFSVLQRTLQKTLLFKPSLLLFAPTPRGSAVMKSHDCAGTAAELHGGIFADLTDLGKLKKKSLPAELSDDEEIENFPSQQSETISVKEMEPNL
ncbi:hypothetical protein CDAR_562411 [Caerostris darwini]|uniref:Uncharacterized protein n=1 Tax=Caerostris darwini TaxID=1538125 RepID=A0AAV4X7G4_9ARAC|nr:hypothetical protein CDAR_562411 [Caerostris darwini]